MRRSRMSALPRKMHILFVLLLLLISSEVSRAQTDVEIARQYYEEGEYEKTIEYLEDDVKRIYSGDLYDILLNSYLALERYKDAEQLIEVFVKGGRLNQIELYTDMIYVNTLEGDEREADKAFEKIRDRIMSNPGLVYNAANALQKRGYPHRALELYELAEAKAPNMRVDYQKALLYGEIGNLNKMYSMYIEMVENSPNYLATVKNLISQGMGEGSNPEDIVYLKELLIKKIQDGGPAAMNDLLIHVFIQERNFRGAFVQLKALDRRSNGNRAEIFNLGRVAINNEEYELAEKVFDYVMAAGKDNPFYEEALVQKLTARNKLLEASGETSISDWKDLQAQYKKAREQLHGYPEAAKVNMDLAHITAFRLDEIDSAIAILESMIGAGYISEEDKARAKIELGDILLYKGDRWDAIIYYGQAEKAFEKSPVGQEAKFKRAKAAYYVGDFQWAEGIFNVLKESTSKLIANDAMQYSLLINDNIALDTSTEAMAVFARADLLNYQGKRDSALILLNVLQREYPGHTLQDEVLLLRSEILTGRGRYDEAAADLQAIIDNFSEDILADDAIFRLADLYEHHLNKPEQAKDLYLKLFTEYPDSFFTAEARKQYRKLRGDILN